MIDTQTQTSAPSFSGLSGVFRRFMDVGVQMVQNRVELIAVELREEKDRVASMMIWGAALVFIGFQSLTAIMLALAVLFREQAVYVFGGFAVFYLIGGLGAYATFKKKMSGPPFSGTIGQLKKDREWIRTGKT